MLSTFLGTHVFLQRGHVRVLFVGAVVFMAGTVPSPSSVEQGLFLGGLAARSRAMLSRDGDMPCPTFGARRALTPISVRRASV